jgi:hypothetical protein
MPKVQGIYVQQETYEQTEKGRPTYIQPNQQNNQN